MNRLWSGVSTLRQLCHATESRSGCGKRSGLLRIRFFLHVLPSLRRWLVARRQFLDWSRVLFHVMLNTLDSSLPLLLHSLLSPLLLFLHDLLFLHGSKRSRVAILDTDAPLVGLVDLFLARLHFESKSRHFAGELL